MNVSSNDLLSVILPVYNVEKYLTKSVTSIINQTYKNIEIILIDDGSTDSSGEICDQLALTDNRITVIHQENRGLAAARNAGLDSASGKWIAFLDSDDWVANEMYEKLISACEETGCELSFCDSVDAHEGQEPTQVVVNNCEPQLMTIDEYLRLLINKDKARLEVWNKVWKRELIDETRYVPGQVSEDIHFNREVLQRLERIAYVPEHLHYYLVQRPGSTATSFKVKRLYAFEEYSTWMVDYYTKQEYHKKSLIAATAANFAIAVYLDSIKNHAPKSSIKLIKQYYEMYRCQVEERNLLSLKHILFSVSPFIYRLLLKIKG